MVNPSKQRGTAAESAVVRYLKKRGWLHAERRTLSGVHDKGDVAGVYGIAGAVVLEVKNCKAASIGAWLAEAQAEQSNAGAALGVVIAKPRGVGFDNVDRWHAHLTFRQLCDLLAAAGYRGTTPPAAEEAA